MFTVISILRVGSAKLLGSVFSFIGNAAIRGFEQLETALERLPQEYENETVRAQEQTVANMKIDLMAYPAASQTSTYVRTFELRHGWQDAPIITSNTMESGVPARESSITNTVPYAGWVQRRGTQAWFHKGRWQTVEDVVAKHTPTLIDAFIRAVNIISRMF